MPTIAGASTTTSSAPATPADARRMAQTFRDVRGVVANYIVVSFLSRLRAALALPAVAAGELPRSFLSPYDDVNHLARIVAPEWFPQHRVIDRRAAMSIPAVSRARRTICNSVARLPLRCYRGPDVLTPGPLWLDRTDGPVSPYHRMLWTVDDLLFHGLSAWAVGRGVDGHVIAADRIPFDQWRIDEHGQVLYRDPGGSEYVADAASIVVIPGSDEGLLNSSPTILGHALDLLAAASRATENPNAYIELHQTNDKPITKAERDELIANWVAARRGVNGGVAFTSAGIEVREHGAPVEHLLVEGRNASALDVARAAGIPGLIVDATTPTASLNYTTAEGKARDLIDYGLSAYMAPISARLGMDDVVPRGISTRFDLESVIGPHATVGTPDDSGALVPPVPPAPPAPPQLRSA